MKITKSIVVPEHEIEVEVEINGSDVLACLFWETEGWTPEQLIKRAFNNFAAFMMRMPDEEIGKLPPGVRQVITDFCESQGKRFHNGRWL